MHRLVWIILCAMHFCSAANAQSVVVTTENVVCPVGARLVFVGTIKQPPGAGSSIVGVELTINNRVVGKANGLSYRISWTASEKGKASVRIWGIPLDGHRFVVMRGFVTVHEPSNSALAVLGLPQVDSREIAITLGGSIKPPSADLVVAGNVSTILPCILRDGALVADYSRLADGNHTATITCIQGGEQYVSSVVEFCKPASLELSFTGTTCNVTGGDRAFTGKLVFGSYAGAVLSLHLDGKEIRQLTPDSESTLISIDASSLASGQHLVSACAVLRGKTYSTNSTTLTVRREAIEAVGQPWLINIRTEEPLSSTTPAKNATSTSNLSDDEAALVESADNLLQPAEEERRAAAILIQQLKNRKVWDSIQTLFHLQEQGKAVEAMSRIPIPPMLKRPAIWKFGFEMPGGGRFDADIQGELSYRDPGKMNDYRSAISREESRLGRERGFAARITDELSVDWSKTTVTVNRIISETQGFYYASATILLEAAESAMNRGNGRAAATLLGAAYARTAVSGMGDANKLWGIAQAQVIGTDVRSDLQKYRAEDVIPIAEICLVPSMAASLAGYLASHVDEPGGVRLASIIGAKPRRPVVRRIKCRSAEIAGNRVRLLLKPLRGGDITQSVLLLASGDRCYGDYVLVQTLLFDETLDIKVDRSPGDKLELSVFYQEGNRFYREDIAQLIRNKDYKPPSDPEQSIGTASQ